MLSMDEAVTYGAGAVAVVGLACRLPGAAHPRALWELLRSGRDAVGAPARSRLASEPWLAGLHGGFLDQVDEFDAAFFGVSPKEAAAMDPQQRLVLELAWEALEDAGIPPAGLAGTSAGVVIGAMAADYAALVYGRGDAAITRHTLAGLTRGILANRISYALDLRGPSLTVDTAQSSALVAVHLACESLRSGESEVALAGGVNLNLAPESTATAERFGGLSPDGRCFTFDSRANGYARGEGGGIVVLKPLRRALADGDHVYAVILGSAVNNDGATPASPFPTPPRSSGSSGSRWREPASTRGTCRSSNCTARARGSATRSRRPRSARRSGRHGPRRSRSWWVRSRRTSAISKARPASPGFSRPCSASTIARSRRA